MISRKTKSSFLNLSFSKLVPAAFAVFSIVLTLSFFKPRLASSDSHVLSLLPEQSSWTDRGIAFSAGVDGMWDKYLWGGFADSLIKKDGVYYFYYQGSVGYDDVCDDNVYRQIGLATSSDGINWTKHTGNPVISWVDSNIVTEGAVSSGAFLGDDGYIYIYYGANSAYTECLVHSSIRLTRSLDGINFEDLGEVVPNTSPLWGSGDEIFPVGVYKNGSSYHVYYIPNGVTQVGKLGVITGTDPATFDLSSSKGVNNGTVPAWGPMSIVYGSTRSYAFVNDNSKNRPLKAYTFNPNVPDAFTLAKTYVFADCIQSSVLLDSDQNRWLLLCRNKADSQFYRIKTAVAVYPTMSPLPTPTPLFSPTPSSSPSLATPTPRPPNITPTPLPTPNTI